jgi:hypothetical protein
MEDRNEQRTVIKARSFSVPHVPFFYNNAIQVRLALKELVPHSF